MFFSLIVGYIFFRLAIPSNGVCDDGIYRLFKICEELELATGNYYFPKGFSSLSDIDKEYPHDINEMLRDKTRGKKVIIPSGVKSIFSFSSIDKCCDIILNDDLEFLFDVPPDIKRINLPPSVRLAKYFYLPNSKLKDVCLIDYKNSKLVEDLDMPNKNVSSFEIHGLLGPNTKDYVPYWDLCPQFEKLILQDSDGSEKVLNSDILSVRMIDPKNVRNGYLYQYIHNISEHIDRVKGKRSFSEIINDEIKRSTRWFVWILLIK